MTSKKRARASKPVSLYDKLSKKRREANARELARDEIAKPARVHPRIGLAIARKRGEKGRINIDMETHSPHGMKGGEGFIGGDGELLGTFHSPMIAGKMKINGSLNGGMEYAAIERPWQFQLADYCVRTGSDGAWGIYLRDFNVRVAKFSDNSQCVRDALARVFDATYALKQAATKVFEIERELTDAKDEQRQAAKLTGIPSTSQLRKPSRGGAAYRRRK